MTKRDADSYEVNDLDDILHNHYEPHQSELILELRSYHTRVVGSPPSNYDIHLKSEHWQEIRQNFLALWGNRGCYICGPYYVKKLYRPDHKTLHLHHFSYEMVGTPSEGCYLLPLCLMCHTLVHPNNIALRRELLYGESFVPVPAWWAMKEAIAYIKWMGGDREGL